MELRPEHLGTCGAGPINYHHPMPGDFYKFFLVAILFYAAFSILKLILRRNPAKDLKQLNKLRERGAITQADYDRKKNELSDL